MKGSRIPSLHIRKEFCNTEIHSTIELAEFKDICPEKKLAYSSANITTSACTSQDRRAAAVRGMTTVHGCILTSRKWENGREKRWKQVRDNIGLLIWNVSEAEAHFQLCLHPQGEPGGSSAIYNPYLELTLSKPALISYCPSPGFHRQEIP